MRIIFITSHVEDYLSDGLLHGLRTLYGEDCIDYPKKDILYNSCPAEKLKSVHGMGFTLYGRLPEIQAERSQVEQRLLNQDYDLVVFGDIWRSYKLFAHYYHKLLPHRTAICDGADSPLPYPASGYWRRNPKHWLLPRAHQKFLYFKREWTIETRFSLAHQLAPRWIKNWLRTHSSLRPISFSIPEEHIVSTPQKVERNYPTHVVDQELQRQLGTTQSKYAFWKEQDYLSHLRTTKFGVTTKRSGWDCLRHYEIAASGCVICFRDLSRKPSTCAPHGLNSTNSLSYSSANEWLKLTSQLDPAKITSLRLNALNWARNHTTVSEAKRLIQALRMHYKRGQ